MVVGLYAKQNAIVYLVSLPLLSIQESCMGNLGGTGQLCADHSKAIPAMER